MNALEVVSLNSDSLQIQVVSPALEERRLTVEFSDESPEVIANLTANALDLQYIRQGDILLLSEQNPLKLRETEQPYHYLSVLLILFSFVNMMRADEGDVLECIVRLPRIKGTVYSLLSDVSQQLGYMFIHDSKVIDSDVVMKIKGGERSIRQAAYDIIGNTSPEFQVVGTHILIALPSEKEIRVQQDFVPEQITNPVIIGALLGKETGIPISSVTAEMRGTSIGSITDRNGDFKLSLSDSLKDDSITFSHIGCLSQGIEFALLIGRYNILSPKPRIVPLQEAVIRRSDPKKPLREMIERRNRSYSYTPAYLTTFYREGARLKNKFQNLSEAVLKVYKAFLYSSIPDQVKLLKVSRLGNVEVKDSLLVKVKSRIQACTQTDTIKDTPEFLTPNVEKGIYDYTSEGITFLGDQFVSVVHFEQKRGISEPLFCGELFFNPETDVLLQARPEAHPVYVENAAGMFVKRRTRNARMIPQKVVYTISYKPWQGTYYTHYIREDLHFKVKWVRMLFDSRDLHTWFEMITYKVDTEQVVVSLRTDRLPTRTVFSDICFRYDEDFWRDFNVIPLGEEISKLIEKIPLKTEEIGD